MMQTTCEGCEGSSAPAARRLGMQSAGYCRHCPLHCHFQCTSKHPQGGALPPIKPTQDRDEVGDEVQRAEGVGHSNDGHQPGQPAALGVLHPPQQGELVLAVLPRQHAVACP